MKISSENRFKLVIFDLDGTLADTAPDVHFSMNQVRAESGLEPIPIDIAKRSIGPGPDLFIKQIMSGDKLSDAQTVIKRFRTIYSRHLLDKTKLFPGIFDVLRELHQKKIRMLIVTNKPERYSRQIIRGLKIEHFFMELIGPESVDNQKPAPDSIVKAMDICAVDPDETLMVGDTEFDIKAARSANVKVCAAGYGYTPVEELIQFHPDYLVRKPEEILTIIFSSEEYGKAEPKKLNILEK